MPTGARLDATFAIRTEHSGDIEPVLTRLGRFTDLVVVDRPGPTRPFTARSGHDPVLRRTTDPDNRQPVSDDPLYHGGIAWTGSWAGTLLIGQAITFLSEGTRITVLHASIKRLAKACADDSAEYLLWHGIVAETVPMAAGSVDAAILAQASGGPRPQGRDAAGPRRVDRTSMTGTAASAVAAAASIAPRGPTASPRGP